MTVEEIKAYAEKMIALAGGDLLETHQRVTIVTAAMGVCGAPKEKP